ncbi:unnamed protein product [Dracunculus medinensis]|uniref:Uncharacterized protein n=1 Tax=Dracunculus medinensis TaxID=318479 RepID=A0A3P7SNY2_DRAME|nr:unnamed protein product [Dracunculus medinensis]
MSFILKDWKSSRTILQPTYNHQHLLISGNECAPGFIYMYHIASNLLIRTFSGHTARVTSISISRNGQFFISTSLDGTTDAIDVLKPHRGKVTCSLVSTNFQYIFTGGTDSCVHKKITGSGDFVVIVWDLSTGDQAVRLGGLMAPVSCVTITSNDAFVIVACEDETLRVFGTVSGQELHELLGHEGKILAVAAAQDDCQIFAGTTSRIYVYDLHSGKLLDTLNCINQQFIFSLKITNDNNFLVSACGNKVDIWNIFHSSCDMKHANKFEKQGYCVELLINKIFNDSPDFIDVQLTTLFSLKDIVTTVAMSKDEKSAACGTKFGFVAVWDLDICQCIWTVEMSKCQAQHSQRYILMIQRKGIAVNCVRFTMNCMYLISGDNEGQICIWEASNGFFLKSLDVKLLNFLHQKNDSITQSSSLKAICFFMDDERVLSVDNSSIIFIWNISTDESPDSDPNISFNGIRAPIILSPYDDRIIGMRIWTIIDENIVPKTKIYHNEEITCFNTTTNFSLLVTGSVDQSLKIWQIDTGFLIQVLVGHENGVICCAIAEDERVVISGSKDSQIIVWNVSTGDIFLSIRTMAPVTAIYLTVDASVAISADETGWIETYDMESGQLLSSFNVHRSIKSLESSADGNRILVLPVECSQLPILCLHNTPAGTVPIRQERRPSTRAHSITSVGSNISEPKASTVLMSSHQNSNLTATTSNGFKGGPRTFDKIERARPKLSVEKERPTNSLLLSKTHSVTIAAKSALCALI